MTISVMLEVQVLSVISYGSLVTISVKNSADSDKFFSQMLKAVSAAINMRFLWYLVP